MPTDFRMPHRSQETLKSDQALPLESERTMSTRGLIGFRYKNNDNLAYNHSDSDPGNLGRNVLGELKQIPEWNHVRELASGFVGIPETRKVQSIDGIVTSEIRRHCHDQFHTKNPRTIYDLYRPLQGTLEPYLSGKLRFIPTANDFIYDSLFCDWAYIANLDSNRFEVWRGLQREPDRQPNRYGNEADRTGYFPCRQILGYSLGNLPPETQLLKDASKYRH